MTDRADLAEDRPGDGRRAMVYQYNCRRHGVEVPSAAMDQLFLANQLWNKLVEIKRSVDERRAEIWRQYPAVAEAEAALAAADCLVEELTAAARRTAATGRSRTAVPSDVRAELRAARLSRAELRRRFRDAKQEMFGVAGEQFRALDADRRNAVKAARNEAAGSGLYWATYNAVVASNEAARKATAGQLRFHRFDGTGTWHVQIQTEARDMPLTFPTLLSDDHKWHNVVRLKGIDPAGVASSVRAIRRAAARGTISIRVASEGRDPVWLVLPVAIHRLPPPDAQIKRVSISRRRVGVHLRHTVQFTVLVEPTAPTCGAGAVAVDLGWRQVSGGLRAGYWLGEDGASGEIVVPDDLAGELERAEKIRSYRDTQFNALRTTLAEWAAGRDGLPDWLGDVLSTLGQWRSPQRLERLVVRWRTRRFDDDAAIFDTCERWRRRENHLYAFESHMRDQQTTRRLDLFRVAAARLADRYSTLVVEDMDLRRLARRTPVEAGNDMPKRVRWQRTVAAPGELRRTLTLAFAARGGTTKSVPTAMTTRRCAACGHEMTATQPAEHQVLTCPGCDRHIDQDRNACENLLAAQRPLE